MINSPTYIFWLFDWATHRIFTSMRYYPRYIRCDIEASGIIIRDATRPISIKYDQVKTCQVDRFSQGRYAGPTSNVKLVLTELFPEQKPVVSGNSIYLVAVNLFRNEPRTPEMEDMVEVINVFRSGNIPSLPTNPYERELIRRGKASEFDAQRWDPLTPPNVYTPVPNPFVFLLKLLVWGAIGTLIITALLGTLYNLFN